MKHRQTSMPGQWLITDERLGPVPLRMIGQLPRGTGVLVRDPTLLAAIRRIAGQRGLVVVEEGRRVVRVHDAREIRQARIAGAEMLLLSPIFATRSHPQWRPLARMRAAALVRLANTRVIALGGMDERRFRLVRGLGFDGWAGIDAWLKPRKSRGRGANRHREP
jgi:thiamine-phosphate pyrophosphorylase